MRYLRYARDMLRGTHVVLAGWLLVAGWGSGLAVPVQAGAATILVVNSLADTIANDGVCTLREAITKANSNSNTPDRDCAVGSGADTITFTVSGTITLVSPLPPITDAAGLTIDGSGQHVTLSGDTQVRVLQVDPGATLHLETLTVANGHSGVGSGGGIVNLGTLTLTASTVSGNIAQIDGGGIYNDGNGTLTLTASTVSGNTARDGGGIYNLGTLTLTNSTLASNTAQRVGGAITNSSNAGGATATLTHCTLAGNTAQGQGAIGGVSGGGIFENGTLTLRRTLIAGNTGSGGPEVGVFGGSVTANDYNLFGLNNTAGVVGFAPGDTDIVPAAGVALDDILAPLADHDGPTLTHALVPGSPARDAVAAACPPPATDQRGISRPQGTACDIGAVEEGVEFNFSGFFPPVDTPPTFNTVHAGRAIPVKFSLEGEQGLAIMAPGFPASQPMACDSRALLDAIEETVTAGGSGLTYDAVSDTYTYVWKTSKTWAGTCRLLIVRLIDGSEHLAQFKF